MAKFCTKCGKPLKDGKPCDCEKNIKEDTSNVNNIMDNCLSILKGMFKNPSKTLKEEANEDNFNLSLISIIINAIVFGLTIHFLISNIFSKAGLNLDNITNSLSNASNQLTALGINLNINTNFGLTSGVLMLVMSIVIIGLLYLMHSVIFKKTINYKEIVSLVGISELFFTLGLLITFIISFISPLLALLILILIALYFIVNINQGIIEITSLNNNQIIYTIAVSIVIPVILFLSVYVSLLSIEVMFLLQGSYSSNLLLGFITL